jgi:hypothetical protein
VNKTSIYNNFRIPTIVEILALRYYLLKGEGNPLVNAILVELGLSYLSSSRLVDNIGVLGVASTLTTIRSKANAAKSKADNIIR